MNPPVTVVERISDVTLVSVTQCLYVSVEHQTLQHIVDGTVLKTYPVSTALNGTGNVENSGMTPLGVHVVAEKFGHGAPLGRIFVDRLDTGETWVPPMDPCNRILSRILWLRGMEDGINRGAGIDTYDRYIYIHGTASEQKIGTPFSHGCVVMRNTDVVELFDLVKEGTYVLID